MTLLPFQIPLYLLLKQALVTHVEHYLIINLAKEFSNITLIFSDYYVAAVIE